MVKVELWHCVSDLQDGSYSTKFFHSEEEMNKWKEKDEEVNGYTTDSGDCLELEIDDKGNVSSRSFADLSEFE